MEYFIYCDTREIKGEDEVMMIEAVMPDKDVLETKESDLPDLERSQVETVRCQASEAHALIADDVKGNKKWRGVSVET